MVDQTAQRWLPIGASSASAWARGEAEGLDRGGASTYAAGMVGRVLPPFVVAVGMLVAPAGAGAQGVPGPDPASVPNATTPDGARTLVDRWTGARVAVGHPPAVLLGVDVAVGAGGRAGEVRVRVPDPARGSGAQVVGPWTVLLAEPGVHRLPAPRVAWSLGGDRPSLDQRTGGHRILKTSPCTPQDGEYADMCQIQHLRVFSPILPDAGPAGTPSTELPGTELSVAAVSEIDLDGDLRGDRTEEPATPGGPGVPGGPGSTVVAQRTDLRVRAAARRLRDGRTRLRITVVNRGPAVATRPRLELSGAAGRSDSWAAPCAKAAREGTRGTGGRGTRCALPVLRVGASRTVTHTFRRGARPGRVTVRVTSEAPTLRRGVGVDRVRARVR